LLKDNNPADWVADDWDQMVFERLHIVVHALVAFKEDELALLVGMEYPHTMTLQSWTSTAKLQ